MSKGHCPRFDQGLEVRFGTIRISKQGIASYCSKKSSAVIPWAAVQSYTMERGVLTVETASRGELRVPTSRIPNLPVLMHALEQLVPGRRSVSADGVSVLRPSLVQPSL